MKRKVYRLKTFLLEFFAGDPEFWQILDRNAVLYDKKNLLSKYWAYTDETIGD